MGGMRKKHPSYNSYNSKVNNNMNNSKSSSTENYSVKAHNVDNEHNSRNHRFTTEVDREQYYKDMNDDYIDNHPNNKSSLKRINLNYSVKANEKDCRHNPPEKQRFFIEPLRRESK